jgi:hypothetical protein
MSKEPIMHRRRLLQLLQLLPMLATPLLRAQPVGAAATLAVVVKALGEAGEALSKITKGIRDAVEAGNDAYGHVAASRVRDRLVELSTRLVRLTNVGNIAVLDSLGEYIHLARSAPASPELKLHWERAVSDMSEALAMVLAILKDVEGERSDFVLQSAYAELTGILHSRVRILSELKKVTPPVTSEAIAELVQIQEKYAELRGKTQELVQQLNAYIGKLNHSGK